MIACAAGHTAAVPARATAEPVPRSPAPAVGGAPPAAAAPVPAAPVRAAMPALSEASVRQLLEHWLAAQNQGDFAAYEALFAERFTGVKRSGPRTRAFGRAAWLADRAAMFRKPMQVGIEQLELSVTAAAARARFVQAWSSGTYSDRGSKEVLIIPSSLGPRIAREEMLASTIDPRPFDAGRTVSLVEQGRLLLSTAVEDSWLRGAARLPPDADVAGQLATAARDVDEASLPPPLQAWKRQTVHVIAADGSSCTARVAAFEARATMVPHFSMQREWSGQDGAAPAQPDQIAAQIWELGSQRLVGVLDARCAGEWWLPAAQPVPKAYVPKAADAELQRAALAAFRKLPSYTAIQRSYVEEHGAAAGPWHEDPESSSFHVWLFAPATAAQLVLVSAEAGEYCGGFGGSLNALFERKPGASGLRLIEAFEAGALTPVSAFDLDGDGRLEILTGPDGRQTSIRMQRWREQHPRTPVAEKLASACKRVRCL